MSEGTDEDYKPTLQGTKLKGQGIERPKRLTRREVNYRESGADRAEAEQGEGHNSRQGVAEGVTLRESRVDSGREFRARSNESVWGGSERSDSIDCWSPGTFERRTNTILEGLQEVSQQINMAKREEMSMADLMKMMIEMSSKDKEEARKREEEREERAIIREEKRLQELRNREDERRRVEDEREEKRLQDIRDREEDRRREENIREERRIEREVREREQAAEREVQLLATLKAAQPAIPQMVHLDSTKLPVMSKGEDLELFLELFESALTAEGVPEA